MENPQCPLILHGQDDTLLCTQENTMTKQDGNNSQIDFFTYISTFRSFLAKNTYLAAFCSIVALFIYGIKIFSYNISMDTELFIGYHYTNWDSIGRYALIAFQKLISVNRLNLFRENFFAAFFLVLATLHWCHFLQFFSGKEEGKIATTVFATSYIVSGIWVEQFYFSLQSAEVSIILFFVPAVIALHIDSLIHKNHLKLFTAILCMAFFISVYQSIIIFYATGLLIAFIFLSSRIGLTVKDGCILIAHMLLGTILYFIISKLLTVVLGVKSSSYLSKMTKPDRSYLLNFIKYCYILGFGNNPLASTLFDNFMAKIARTGEQAVFELHKQSYAISNTAFYPAAAAYCFLIIRNKKYTTIKKILLVLIPFTVLIFPAVCGGICLNRTQFVVPLVTAFIYFTILTNLSGNKKIIVAVMLLYCSYIQMQRSSTLFYCDQIRFESDLNLAQNIDKEIKKTDFTGKKVFLYGRFTPSYPYEFAYGEDIGKSMFNADSRHDIVDSTRRGIGFMRAVGFLYEPVEEDTDNMLEAREHAKSMPHYPSEGYVEVYKNILIVKLSEEEIPDQPL
ncbi:MAG: glucosyltransferase domain-containing protein [Treponema sp.]|nr:glucosyltransferase domain-containing protein [Treponema sp.]